MLLKNINENRIFTIIILGGYGNFGHLIARSLSTIPNIELIIAGRSLIKAQECIVQLGVGKPLQIDSNDSDLSEKLRCLNLDLIISTIGPFQGQDYKIPQISLELGAHYIDLADARDYVCQINQLDAAAKAAQKLICVGASSVPGLSSAVIDYLKDQFLYLDTISMCISTSEQPPGLSTFEAMLDYIGKPFSIWKDNQWQTIYGWQNIIPIYFNKKMGWRLVINCDVPDLELFPARYHAKTVEFKAGVGLKITQLSAWLLSWLVRFKLIKNQKKLAPFLLKSASLFKFLGNGVSGMSIILKGLDHNQQPLELNWKIIASHNQGINIPCIVAVALAKKLATGQFTVTGAMSSMGLLTLRELLDELPQNNIELFLNNKKFVYKK